MHLLAALLLALAALGTAEGAPPCPAKTGLNSTGSCVPCADSRCLRCEKNYKRCTECTSIVEISPRTDLQPYYYDSVRFTYYISRQGTCEICDWTAPNPIDKDSPLVCNHKRLPGCNRDGECKVCPEHTGRVGTKCIICADRLCANCYGDPHKCLACIKGYQLVDGKCIPCRGTINPFERSCSVCDPPRVCKKCAPGHGLDPHDSTLCRPCAANHAPDKELPEGIPCNNCAADYRRCIACTRPVNQDTSLSQNTFVSAKTGKCSLCPLGCRTEPGRCNWQGHCLTCSDGYGFNTAKKTHTPRTCELCKGNVAGDPPVNCLSCVPGKPDQCIKCAPRGDGNGRYWDAATKRCRMCPESCAQCSKGGTCDRCFQGYTFKNGRCQLCPGEGCMRCTPSGTCLECLDYEFTQQGYFGYDYDEATKTCIPFSVYA